MAIKIDLLPGHLRLQKLFKRLLALSLLLIGSTAAFLFLFHSRQSQNLAVINADIAAIQPQADAKNAADKAASDTRDASDTTRAAVTFFVQAEKTGPQRAALLDSVRRYIYGRARVDAVDISDGQTVRVTSNVFTTEDYTQFLRNLRRAEDDAFFQPGQTQGSGIPTYDNGVPSASDATTDQSATGGRGGTGQTAQPVSVGSTLSFPISANFEAKLVNPVIVPAPAGAAAAAAAAGTSGSSGNANSARR